jgi:3-oxoacyl-[acyl-carrier protein] reductase
MIDLSNKVALVTGGSRGIGSSIATTLAGAGAEVIINYSGSKTSADEIVDKIEQTGRKALAIKADVSDPEQVDNMIKLAIEHFGHIDILVNNAGITRDNLLVRLKQKDWNDVVDINLSGVYNCTKGLSRHLIKRRGGRIINIASVVGITGNVGQANYCAAKAGVIGFTKAVARELASRSITANAVAPGFINTDMTKILPDEVKKGMLSNIPLGMAGEPQDIANMVAFLASDLARYITGQVFVVDGGMAM